MNTHTLISLYAYKMTSDIAIAMETENGKDLIYVWDAYDNRHPDDGSFANVLYHIPDDIALAEVKSFDVIPKVLMYDDDIIFKHKTETLYITIPSYTHLYKYITD